MRRLLPTLIAASVALAGAAEARAAGPVAPDAGSCEPVERELQQTRRALDDARDDAQQAHQQHDACAADLASTTQSLGQAQGATRSCQQAKDHLCSATSGVVDDVLREHVPDAAQTGCVSGDQQKRLGALLRSWSDVRAALSQMSAYADGDSDRVGPLPGGSTALDRLMQRIAAGEHGTPLSDRRLLVEAMRLVAPKAWAAIHKRGPMALDAWFAGREPLDPGIVEEAQHATQGAPGPAGPPLSAALRLVRVYELLAHCADAPQAASCPRASQLHRLLESTGPLVVRRRIQDVWATECANVSPRLVLAWVADFPSSRVTESADYGDITRAAYDKLFSCYLGDAAASEPFASWLDDRLPDAKDTTSDLVERLDEIRAYRKDGAPEEVCARAVRSMQRMRMPSSCTAPTGAERAALEAWTSMAAGLSQDAAATVRVCREYARLYWEGERARIAGSFARPPSVDDMVAVDAQEPQTPMGRLRSLCARRSGTPDELPDALRTLGAIARGFGDSTTVVPWRLDPQSDLPVELTRFRRADTTRGWLEHLLQRDSGCRALELGDARCKECPTLPAGTAYDCALADRLDANWLRRTRLLVGSLLLLVLSAAFVGWGRRMRAAHRRFGAWARDTSRHLAGLGLSVRRDGWRHLVPSRNEILFLDLPREAAWERWGACAGVLRAPPGPRLSGRDIDRAAQVAHRAGAAAAIVVHDDDASPDLSAVRSILEWAARGGARAVQIVTISQERLLWTKGSRDVLALVEETSLRGDPFELRGRITSSSQFFNRERLVSGLLAAAQAGRWQVVTGLRRFGKSSLSLEVARRLPGPSAYVDLAAFHHEIGSAGDPGRAADAILRYVCTRLDESARALYGDAVDLPPPMSPDARIDAGALAAWFDAFSSACRSQAGGRQPPTLVVLDEIEQALAVGPERIRHAVDSLAVTIGRLKGALGETPAGGSPVGVFLCSTPHSILWAPLGALAGQSIMASFPSVCVPCLSEEAASSMMKSLGLRQGIRFADAALESIIAESQGVPLLLRRIGSSVLELYDAERARHGGLGAVDIGIEGAGEAIQREMREGSPLRVWVESEICDRSSPAGAVLRQLAREERVEVRALCETAARVVARDFAHTGIDRALSSEEVARRTEEAAAVILRLLGETGLLEAIGDLTSPDAYALPDGIIRRVLRLRPSINASPIAHPAP